MYRWKYGCHHIEVNLWYLTLEVERFTEIIEILSQHSHGPGVSLDVKRFTESMVIVSQHSHRPGLSLDIQHFDESRMILLHLARG